jgi:thiosulfate/3-mercaptopyruvate sulfurtransferase
MGEPGLAFIYTTRGISKHGFALLFTVIAVICFWASEYIERRKDPLQKGGMVFKAPFLQAFSLILIIFGGALLLFPVQKATSVTASKEQLQTTISPSAEKALLTSVASAEDHIEPEELADRLSSRDSNIVVIDVRPPEEYVRFHIRGAVNVVLPDLPDFVEKQKGKGFIVLYSNGMVHPAQARDALYRMGYRNIYILTDGLVGFIGRCLKPASLRSEPIPPALANRITVWREYFYGS